MDGLEFASATIGQLAWPALLVTLGLSFRKPIREAVSSRLTRLKAGPAGLQLEFKEDLEEARELVESGQKDSGSSDSEVPSGPAGETPSDFIDEMTDLARVSPRAVVLESHTRLEKLLRDALGHELRAKKRGGPIYSMNTLNRVAMMEELITPQESRALHELTSLRNRVAHEPDHVISESDALGYAELVRKIAVSIRRSQGITSSTEDPILGYP